MVIEQLAVCSGLGGAPADALPIEAVRLEVGTDERIRIRALAVMATHRELHPVQRIGGEVGAEVRAVAEDGPVLHQAPRGEELLTSQDLLARDQRRTVRPFEALGDRRAVRLDAIGEVAEYAEAERERQDGHLEPRRRDDHLPAAHDTALPSSCAPNSRPFAAARAHRRSGVARST